MQFPLQFSSLTIPTGAGPKQQRITINDGNNGKIQVYDSTGNLVDSLGGSEGEFILYDSAGNMVVSIASDAGTDPRTGLAFQAGITTYTSDTAINLFGEDGTWTASDGSKIVVESGLGATVFFTPQDSVTGPWFAGEITTQVLTHPGLSIESPSNQNTGLSSSIELQGSSNLSSSTFINMAATSLVATAICQFGNIAFGSVTITPSAANTPTSATISFGPLLGNSFIGFTTVNSSVPGTQVTGTSINTLDNSSGKVWLTRTNTTATIVYWMVVGF